jgi:hypothetical protein
MVEATFVDCGDVCMHIRGHPILLYISIKTSSFAIVIRKPIIIQLCDTISDKGETCDNGDYTTD